MTNATASALRWAHPGRPPRTLQRRPDHRRSRARSASPPQRAHPAPPGPEERVLRQDPCPRADSRQREAAAPAGQAAEGTTGRGRRRDRPAESRRRSAGGRLAPVHRGEPCAAPAAERCCRRGPDAAGTAQHSTAPDRDTEDTRHGTPAPPASSLFRQQEAGSVQHQRHLCHSAEQCGWTRTVRVLRTSGVVTLRDVPGGAGSLLLRVGEGSSGRTEHALPKEHSKSVGGACHAQQQVERVVLTGSQSA